MRTIKKKIILDEQMNPTAVIIDYQDWQEIERLLTAEKHLADEVDINRYAGVIKLSEDPLEFQYEIRSEWP